MIGGMFRLAAIQAAVLDVKLKYLNEWHEARRRHAAVYNKLFAGTKITPPPIEAGNRSIYNQYVVRVPADRDAVKQKLHERGIATAVYYPIPLHEQECFKYLGHKSGDFPESERACREVLALPVYPELTDEQVKYVAKTLLEIVG
jgi:dTDP-4-amino-4,6-dideoxygalactose transaminase